MKKEEFFSKIELTDNSLIFNDEAVETMNLDAENAKVIIMEAAYPEKKKNSKEVLIFKTNGSAIDNLEDVKDAIPAEKIRSIQTDKDGRKFISLPKDSIKMIHDVFGSEKRELKLLPCNMDSSIIKEFKETFEVSDTMYRVVYLNDKRTSIGKERDVKTIVTERVKLEATTTNEKKEQIF